eukprot:superscaffoldBa00005336_g20209
MREVAMRAEELADDSPIAIQSRSSRTPPHRSGRVSGWPASGCGDWSGSGPGFWPLMDGWYREELCSSHAVIHHVIPDGGNSDIERGLVSAAAVNSGKDTHP